LTTILWQYDSNDWKVGTGNVTTATVDANYQNLSTLATNGTFSSVNKLGMSSGVAVALIGFLVQMGTIMLTHELNNYTMQEAVKFHPTLATSFKVFSVLLPFNCRKSDLAGM
jgi:hypothetical protein